MTLPRMAVSALVLLATGLAHSQTASPMAPAVPPAPATAPAPVVPAAPAAVPAMPAAPAAAPVPAGPSADTAAAGARFRCGGIGQADQQAMEAAASQYDLMLTFATSTGAYVADVDVEIVDRQGAVVLATRCPGPLMLVGLPGKGAYRVTARHNGQTRQKTLSAGGRTVFTWPAS